jgi:hypothetical protein
MTEKNSLTPEAAVEAAMASMGTPVGLDARFRPALQALAAALLALGTTEPSSALARQITAWLVASSVLITQVITAIPGLTDADFAIAFAQALHAADIDPVMAEHVMEHVMETLAYTGADPGPEQS